MPGRQGVSELLMEARVPGHFLGLSLLSLVSLGVCPHRVVGRGSGEGLPRALLERAQPRGGAVPAAAALAWLPGLLS